LFGLNFKSNVLFQWFPKCVVPPLGAVRDSRGRWSRNGRLGGDRRPS